MVVLSDVLQAVSVVLQVVLLVLLLKGSSFRKYPIVLVYCCARLATHTVLMFLLHQYGTQNRYYRWAYWTDELLLDLLLFLMVTIFIHQALEGKPQRAGFDKVLAAIVALVIVLPFLIFARPFSTHWFNATNQLLNFGAAIMNLFLWTALLGFGRRDAQLLTVSVGVGIAVTGAAISFGVRQWMPAHQVVWLPNTFMALTHIAGVFIWCWAFRPAPRTHSIPADALKA